MSQGLATDCNRTNDCNSVPSVHVALCLIESVCICISVPRRVRMGIYCASQKKCIGKPALGTARIS
eukprot:14443287-Alexandrium_andersonii.AAC.1